MTVLPRLRGCFECTTWETFYDSCSSVSDLVDTVTDYMNFCVDTILPKKCVKIYPNEKPWVTKEVKKLLKAKQHAFRTGDRISLKIAQAELKACVRKKTTKIRYRRNLSRTTLNKHGTASSQSLVVTNRRNAALPQTPPNLLTI